MVFKTPETRLLCSDDELGGTEPVISSSLDGYFSTISDVSAPLHPEGTMRFLSFVHLPPQREHDGMFESSSCAFEDSL